MFTAEPVHLLGKAGAELGKRRLLEKPLLHRTQHGFFDFLPANAAEVVAGAALSRVEARQSIMRGQDEPAAQDSHTVSPEKRYFGRRAATIPCFTL